MQNITLEEAQALKKQLRRGDLTLIAKRLNISRVAVHYALTGTTQKSDYILQAVAALAHQRAAEQKKILQNLSSQANENN